MSRVFIMKNDLNVVPKYKEFLTIDYDFIPFNINEKLNIKDNKRLLKNEYFTTCNYSYISGEAVGLKKCSTINGDVKCLAVKNDFKEQKLKVKKGLFEERINKCDKNILDKLNNQSKNLVFSIICDEPNISNYAFLVDKYYEDMFAMVDVLKEKFQFKNVFVVIKDQERKNIESLINIIGSFPSIKIVTVPNVYPILGTSYLSNILGITDYCLLNPLELLEIINVVKSGNNLCEKIITVCLDEDCYLVKVKLGTLLDEVLKFLNVSWKDKNVYLNGCISGKKVDDISNFIITKEFMGVVITKNIICDEQKCINCGNCSSFCPVGLNPRKFLSKDKIVDDKNLEKCLQCGLCNYVCPSYIKLKEKIEEVLNDKVA